MKFGLDFARTHEEELRGFLFKAMKHGYGSEDKPNIQPDGLHEITYREGDWEYYDSWYGGQPYSGSTVIRCRGEGCWSMTYFGQTVPGIPQKPIFECLKEALKACDPAYPYRGPEYFRATNGLRYMNRWDDVWETQSFGFQGKEIIVNEKGQSLYEMNYSGGFVNLF